MQDSTQDHITSHHQDCHKDIFSNAEPNLYHISMHIRLKGSLISILTVHLNHISCSTCHVPYRLYRNTRLNAHNLQAHTS